MDQSTHEIRRSNCMNIINQCQNRPASLISYESKLKGESKSAYTAQDILGWQYNSDTEDFKRLDYSCYEPFVDEYFKKYGDKLHIIENGGRNGLTAERIYDIASRFRLAHHNEKLVIIVDYLQIVSESKKPTVKAKPII